MKRFPAPVREAMRRGGAAATCVPVAFAGGEWEAALFFQASGPECKADRRALREAAGRPFPVGLESEVIETEHGAVIMLRAEVHTRPGDPLSCEILLTPGAGGTHFDVLELLGAQPRLGWFLGDQAYWLLHSQQHPLDAEQHAGFDALLKEALRHDAVVRLTGRYDATAALGEVARLYELRAGALRAHEVAPAGRSARPS